MRAAVLSIDESTTRMRVPNSMIYIECVHRMVLVLVPCFALAPYLVLFLLWLLLRLCQDLLVLEQLGQFAVLVHRNEDVAAANELLADVELGNRGPVGVLFDAYSQQSASGTRHPNLGQPPHLGGTCLIAAPGPPIR